MSAPAPLRLQIRVTPSASRDKIARDPAGGVRVWVTVAPTDGKANKAVVKLLSKRLGVSKSSISIASGATSRDKRLEIDGLCAADVERLIPSLAPDGGGA